MKFKHVLTEMPFGVVYYPHDKIIFELSPSQDVIGVIDSISQPEPGSEPVYTVTDGSGNEHQVNLTQIIGLADDLLGPDFKITESVVASPDDLIFVYKTVKIYKFNDTKYVAVVQRNNQLYYLDSQGFLVNNDGLLHLSDWTGILFATPDDAKTAIDLALSYNYDPDWNLK